MFIPYPGSISDFNVRCGIKSDAYLYLNVVSRMPLFRVSFQLNTGKVFQEVAATEIERKGVKLDELMNALPSMPRDIACWIRGTSGNIWLRVPDDRMLYFLIQSYLVNDKVFDVVLRAEDAASPNTNPALSRNVSEQATEHLTRLQKLSVSRPDDPEDSFTMIRTDELEQDGIDITDGKVTIRVDIDWLIAFVKTEVKKGIPIARIELDAFDNAGKRISIVLSTEVWVRCLLRGHARANEILTLIITMCTAMREYDSALKTLHANIDLWNRVKIFLQDLLTFGSDTEARERLEADPAASYYVSSVYFTSDEIQLLLNFPTYSGLTFQQCVEASMVEKMAATSEGNSRDYNVCTSHDLAPMVRDAFGIRKSFQEKTTFKEALKVFKEQWKKGQKRNR